MQVSDLVERLTQEMFWVYTEFGDFFLKQEGDTYIVGKDAPDEEENESYGPIDAHPEKSNILCMTRDIQEALCTIVLAASNKLV